MKRYVIAGAGSRCHYMFAKPIVEKFKERFITTIEISHEVRCIL